MKHKAIRILGKIGNVLLWVFLVFAIAMTTLVLVSQDKTELPSVFGKSFLSVQSPSMTGTFDEGSLIVAQMLTPEEKMSLGKGDVIVFYSDLDGDGYNEINTHRIVDIREQGGNVYYTTKGDANSDIDRYPNGSPKEVHYGNVLGKWTGTVIPGVGAVVTFLQKPLGFGVCIVVPLILFFLYELYQFVLVLITNKQKKAAAVDEEEIKRRAVEEYIRQQAAKQAETEKKENNDPDNGHS